MIGFYVGNFEEGADQLFFALLGFTLYPQTVFSGALKLITLTILPAFFIAALPVSIMRTFSFTGLGIVAVAAVVSATLAITFFRISMRRYESGNAINVNM